MQVPALSNISNSELMVNLKALTLREREAIAEVILHLSEVDRRRLYRDAGYSSLFAYCTEGLRYSEGGAYRRITAARCLKDHPELYEKVKSGKITLCAVVELSKVITMENRAEILALSEGKPKAEVQRIVATYGDVKPVGRESVRVKKVNVSSEPDLLFAPSSILNEGAQMVEKERFTITFDADSEFMTLYAEVKALSGAFRFEDVFRLALKGYISRKSPKEREKRREDKKAIKDNVSPMASRHIPLPVRDKVHMRDGARCTFTSPDGRRCGETHAPEVDHIIPHALGGSSQDPENLRLLCRCHNTLMAERVFGAGKVRSYHTKKEFSLNS